MKINSNQITFTGKQLTNKFNKDLILMRYNSMLKITNTNTATNYSHPKYKNTTENSFQNLNKNKNGIKQVFKNIGKYFDKLKR